MRRKATSSCCRALLLCSNRDRATFSSDARPGLAPIQSLPPLVYSVYSRQRQQFSADARLAGLRCTQGKVQGLDRLRYWRKKERYGSGFADTGQWSWSWPSMLGFQVYLLHRQNKALKGVGNVGRVPVGKLKELPHPGTFPPERNPTHSHKRECSASSKAMASSVRIMAAAL